MENKMMTMTDVSCVLSARLRPVGHVRLADGRGQGQGTVVSAVALTVSAYIGFAGSVIGAVEAGVKAGSTKPTTDVAFSHAGRPPV